MRAHVASWHLWDIVHRELGPRSARKRTMSGHRRNGAIDPSRTSAGQFCCHAQRHSWNDVVGCDPRVEGPP
jgi:hypothetical protein